jgi:hypothetical protein
MSSSSSSRRVAPLLAAGTTSSTPSENDSRPAPPPTIMPLTSSSSNGNNNKTIIAVLSDDDQLDELDLQAFADDTVPQERIAVYSNDENENINHAIIVNEKRLKDTRWKPLASFHSACKHFTLIEDGESILTARGEGIVHCSAPLALANCWMRCNRRSIKLHKEKNGSELPKKIYRVVNKHHEFYITYKVCLSLFPCHHSHFLFISSISLLPFCSLSHAHLLPPLFVPDFPPLFESECLHLSLLDLLLQSISGGEKTTALLWSFTSRPVLLIILLLIVSK